MKLQDLKNFSEKKKNTLYFDYNIKNLNWFNIGGKSKLFYKPDSLKDLSEFLKFGFETVKFPFKSSSLIFT